MGINPQYEAMRFEIASLKRAADDLRAKLAAAEARVVQLTGHLDWIGWSSEGVAACQQQLAATEARAKLEAAEALIAEYEFSEKGMSTQLATARGLLREMLLRNGFVNDDWWDRAKKECGDETTTNI